MRTPYGQGLPPRVKRGRTKPGSLLKSQIPLPTWADWNEDQPGFTKMDWVSHDGGLERGVECNITIVMA